MKNLIALSLALCLLAFSAKAKDAEGFLTQAEIDAHRGTIDRVEDYLSGLTTIVSDFTQTAPDGSLATGTFYLKRPGMMRWEYNPPTPVLMVADGYKLTYYDYELEQVSHIKMDETMIGFLARNPIRFDKDVGLREISSQNGVIRIRLAQRDNPDNGELTLEFSDKPLQIRNMVVRDATQQKTTVALNHAQYGKPIDKKLFDFKDPRPGKFD